MWMWKWMISQAKIDVRGCRGFLPAYIDICSLFIIKASRIFTILPATGISTSSLLGQLMMAPSRGKSFNSSLFHYGRIYISQKTARLAATQA